VVPICAVPVCGLVGLSASDRCSLRFTALSGTQLATWGKTKTEILGCLKRYIAREACPLLGTRS
jgi:hypothetical protein